MAETRRDLSLLAVSSGLSVYLVGLGLVMTAIVTGTGQVLLAGFVLLAFMTLVFAASLVPLYPYLRIALGKKAFASTPWGRGPFALALYVVGESLMLISVLSAILNSYGDGSWLITTVALGVGAGACYTSLRLD